MNLVSNFLGFELNFVFFVQKVFFKYESFFSVLSVVFESNNVYCFLIPAFAALNTNLYHKVLLSCIATDFATLALKWITIVDAFTYRPIWWYYENVTSYGSNPFKLYQTDKTCVPSEGNPSRHLAIATAIFYVICAELLNYLVRAGHRRKRFLTLMKYASIILSIFLLLGLTISRMYFSTNFLHHCIFGIVVGYFVAKFMSKFHVKLNHYTKLDWFKLQFALIAYFIVYYNLFRFLGSPQWSVKMAFKYCNDPYLINPDKTVIYGTVKATSLILGILIVSPLENLHFNARLNHLKSIPITSILIVAQYIAIFYTPRQYKYVVFYSYTFIINTISQSIFLYLIPKLCSLKHSSRKLKRK